MNPIVKLVKGRAKKARERRAAVFRRAFQIGEDTKILDLGSEDGSNINLVLQGTPIKPEHVYIADIDPALIEKGKITYGYIPVVINESGNLPFSDRFFDIVYCSSVIEHATVSKDQVWSLRSGAEFRRRALVRQQEIASEIMRVGKQYFVQTPYKHFPIESHSWLPLVSWLPRRMLVALLKLTNVVWVKKTSPDWCLLNKSEMENLFQGAHIVDEKFYGLTKSIMAIKSAESPGEG